MKFEWFVARRYFSSGRYFVSVSTWITILGVALGVAAVCVAVSVSNGFGSEIRTRLLGTTSHISIFPTGENYLENYEDLVQQVESIDGVVAASPFIYYKAGISSTSASDGIIVRGIDLESEARTSDIEKSVLVGEYTFREEVVVDDTLPGILLGQGLAERLAAFIGQPVIMYAMRGEDIRRASRPRIAKFYVAGIFETGVHDFDAQLAYISLEAAQDLFRTGRVATAVHLKLTDIFLADDMAPIIDGALDFRYDVVPWTVLHKNLFSWIEFEKLIIALSLTLIVLVAAFSIISTLVMTTMEKRAEIGILKTMGSTPSEILRIFVSKGAMIGMIGVGAGWILAALLAWLQNRFQLFELPPDIFFIRYLPVEARPEEFLAVGVVTFGICLLAALYPAYQAARISVIDVLRQ
jgi:lipoprotein-releasing system permease protein